MSQIISLCSRAGKPQLPSPRPRAPAAQREARAPQQSRPHSPPLEKGQRSNSNIKVYILKKKKKKKLAEAPRGQSIYLNRTHQRSRPSRVCRRRGPGRRLPFQPGDRFWPNGAHAEPSIRLRTAVPAPTQLAIPQGGPEFPRSPPRH